MTNRDWMFLLQKEVEQLFNLTTEEVSYSDLLINGQISRYFSLGFIRCNSLKECEYILPSFLQQHFKQYFQVTSLEPIPQELVNYVKNNKHIHELLAEKYMIYKLLE